MLNFLKNAPKPQYALLDKIRNQLEGVKKQTSQKTISKNGLIRQNKKKMLNYSVGNCGLQEYSYSTLAKENLDGNSLIHNRSKQTSTEKKQKIRNKNTLSPPLFQGKSIMEKTSITSEISNEVSRAIGLLRNKIPVEYDDEFFKGIMLDITNLIIVLNNIALEAANLSDELSEKINGLELERKATIQENYELKRKLEELKNNQENIFKKSIVLKENNFKNSEFKKNLDELKGEIKRLNIENKKLWELALNNRTNQVVKEINDRSKIYKNHESIKEDHILKQSESQEEQSFNIKKYKYINKY